MSGFYRAFLLFVFALLLPPADSVATIPGQSAEEHLIAIRFDGSEPDRPAGRIPYLERLGFRIVEVPGRVDDALVEALESSRMTLFVRQPRMFTTSIILQQADSLFHAEDEELIRFYERRFSNRFAGFAPFTYPNDLTAAGLTAITEYAERLYTPRDDDFHLYYLSAGPATAIGAYAPYSFRSARNRAVSSESVPVRHFVPTGDLRSDLNRFYDQLEFSRAGGETVLFVPFSWIDAVTDRYDWFEEILTAYNTGQELIRLEPASDSTPPPLNLDVLLLLLLLASLAIHLQMNPPYREAIWRYFFSHSYFLEQLVHYRARHFFTGFILLIQHALLTGTLLLILSETILSDVGVAVITDKLPSLSFFRDDGYHLFLIGTLFALAVQALSVIWLQLFNRGYTLRQTLLLYGWPLQINMITIVIMTALNQAGGPEAWINLLAILFVTIWVLGFTAAAFDLSTGVSHFRILYLIGTAGLHILLHLFLLVTMVYYPPVSEVVRMALEFR